MNDRPTPETDRRIIKQSPRMCGCHYESEIVFATLARRLERERDEAREWQAMLAGWGGTPEIVHDFIKGQQMRIYAAQEAERERDESREAAEKAKSYKRVMKEDNANLRRELNEAREELDELSKRVINVSRMGVDLIIEREDSRKLLREIFNLTQIGEPHPDALPMNALRAIADMIDEHLKEARK